MQSDMIDGAGHDGHRIYCWCVVHCCWNQDLIRSDYHVMMMMMLAASTDDKMMKLLIRATHSLRSINELFMEMPYDVLPATDILFNRRWYGRARARTCLITARVSFIIHFKVKIHRRMDRPNSIQFVQHLSIVYSRPLSHQNEWKCAQKYKCGRLTGFCCVTAGWAITNRYHIIHSKLFAANDTNRFMWMVIRAHFNDLKMKWERTNEYSTIYIYCVCVHFTIRFHLIVCIRVSWTANRIETICVIHFAARRRMGLQPMNGKNKYFWGVIGGCHTNCHDNEMTSFSLIRTSYTRSSVFPLSAQSTIAANPKTKRKGIAMYNNIKLI